MIEEFDKLVPECMNHLSGAVFFSGREAFSHPSRLYVLGINPGGKPENYRNETVGRHTKWVIDCAPSRWSEYRDGQWSGTKGPGANGIQPSLRHLFDVVDLDPGTVPSSNIVFARSSSVSKYPRDFDNDAGKCWSFHQDVIDRLRVEVVVVFGGEAGSFACERLGANRIVKSWTDKNKQPWKSVWYRNANRLDVVVLAHPTMGHQWTRSASDPTGLAVEALSA